MRGRANDSGGTWAQPCVWRPPPRVEWGLLARRCWTSHRQGLQSGVPVGTPPRRTAGEPQGREKGGGARPTPSHLGRGSRKGEPAASFPFALGVGEGSAGHRRLQRPSGHRRQHRGNRTFTLLPGMGMTQAALFPSGAAEMYSWGETSLHLSQPRSPLTELGTGLSLNIRDFWTVAAVCQG